MAKNLMRRYNTQEEYEENRCSINVDTVTAIMENDKVNYRTITNNPYAVIINNCEEHIFEDDKIPTKYFNGRTDITSVTINDGITHISEYAFMRCSLTSITILNNVNVIDNYAFYGCTALSTINYYGTLEPTLSDYSFKQTGLSTINVTKDYEGDTFGSFTVNKVL